nr:MAG TPA: hypothetical protein [Caudoviricetes sp.]
MRGRGNVLRRRGQYKSEAIVWDEKLVAGSAHSIN